MSGGAFGARWVPGNTEKTIGCELFPPLLVTE
jgi:hypothetical protein